MKLLLVEDEDRIASFLEKGLGAHGYAVTRVATGEGALAALAGDWPDLVILDLGLPDVDGLEVLRRLRANGRDVPVIVLTARGTVNDRVQRPKGNGPATELRAGDLAVDLLTRDARLGDRSIVLTSREFSLLEEFLRHPRHVLTRQQLLSSVWGLGFDPGSNLVDVYVGYLRRKLGEAAIETVRGVGYRLTDPGARADKVGEVAPTTPTTGPPAP